MSMNISAHSAPRSVTLALALMLGSVSSTQAATQPASKSYYRTVSIDQVLGTRPALVTVSPLYQVTLQVVGAEITGISMELSKQKNFSVSRAENGRMVFLDSLVKAGGADLNLILDDETVLPIRLQVTNAPSGTRIYKFMTGDALAAQVAATQAQEEEEPAVQPQVTPAPAAPAAPATPPAPAPQPPAPPTGSRPVQTAPAAKAAPAPVARPVAAPAVQRPTTAAKTATAQPAVATTPPRPVAAPASPRPAAAPMTTRPAAAAPAATLEVSARRDGADALVAYKLTSPAGGTLFSNTKTLQVTDGRGPLTMVPVTLPRSSMAPILGLVRVKNAPRELVLSLTAQTLGPARTFTLSRKVTVQ